MLGFARVSEGLSIVNRQCLPPRPPPKPTGKINRGIINVSMQNGFTPIQNKATTLNRLNLLGLILIVVILILPG